MHIDYEIIYPNKLDWELLYIKRNIILFIQ